MLPEFIEYTVYNGYKYGRRQSDILKAKHTNMVIDLEPHGLSTYIEFCQEHDIDYITVYLKCTDDQIRLRRVIQDKDRSRIYRDDNYFDQFLFAYDIVIDVTRIPLEKIVNMIMEVTK